MFCFAGLQYMAFCTATGSAALLAAARDGTLAIVRLAHKEVSAKSLLYSHVALPSAAECV
jgi:hypothetical protein